MVQGRSRCLPKGGISAVVVWQAKALLLVHVLLLLGVHTLNMWAEIGTRVV